MSFTAKYRSPCANDDCEDGVLPGQEVEWAADHRVIHVVCPEDRDISGKPLPICPRCFLAIPVSGVCGVCDD